MEEFENVSEIDTYVLIKSIEGLLNLVKTQTKCYNELREMCIECKKQKTNLAFFDGDVVEIEQNYIVPDLNKLKNDLSQLKFIISQMNKESVNTKTQTDSVIRQLQAENQELKDEIKRLRMKMNNKDSEK